MGRGALCWLRRWLPLLLIWLMATAADRAWLAADQAAPAWDQADYLNSAVDHGRALGLLPGGEWSGWRDFLLLSPKIPPLASLVHGVVMAVAGELPDQASWALAIWHGLLLLALDGWARQLHSPRLAILALILAALSPGLISLRVNFTLDLALTAVTTAALWQLWRWQRPAPHGGRWVQALLAALGLAAALLVKQSAILVLAAPTLWAVVTGIGQHRRRLQLLAGMALVLALILPWLHQNWITAIGGTHRAVVDSARSEGDPPVFSLASLLYYPRLWWQQLGALPCLGAVAGPGGGGGGPPGGGGG
ncbi:MAG TPA: 4-amino-4-deoxy-L-arabinose transferase, partial [Synechococcus sp. UBA8638]|nr:4-amino-4-deoxy-L-arabinose transferase [Synechococcus sp. UBA8638]